MINSACPPSSRTVAAVWWARREERLCPPYEFFHSRVSPAISAVSASRIADGVRGRLSHPKHQLVQRGTGAEEVADGACPDPSWNPHYSRGQAGETRPLLG